MSKTQYKSLIDRNKQSSKGLHIVAGVRDNTDLSKRKSGMPCRYPLAFFVSKFAPMPHIGQIDSTHPTPFTGVNHHFLDVSIFGRIPSYDGVTLQNKPLWRICEAVAFTTESEPHHPMTFHSVVITQKLLGGYHA